MFTIFGYSAPKTDVEAIDLLKQAWGAIGDRNLEQTEIINRPGCDSPTHGYHITRDAQARLTSASTLMPDSSKAILFLKISAHLPSSSAGSARCSLLSSNP